MYKYAFVLLSSLVRAQQPVPIPLERPGFRPPVLRDVKPEERGLIEGRVVNAVTGEGIRKASIQLNWAGGGGVTLRTDAEGRFRAEQMAPGQYYPNVTASGYVGESFDGTNPIRLAPGGSNRSVTIRLAPHAVISGRVLDEDGDPVPQAMIGVESRRRRGGQAGPVGHGTTNDLGEFRVAGLAAGKYVISANKQGNQMQQNAPSPSLMAPGAQDIPVTTYFPSAADALSATVVTLAPGAEHRGAEIRLRKSASVTVSGKVDYHRQEGTQAYVSVQLSRTKGPDIFRQGNHTMAQPDGRFQFASVIPGEYMLLAHVNVNKPGAPPVQLDARLRVQVGSADLPGLVVMPRAPLSVSGEVKNQGEETDLSRLTVNLMPAEGAGVPQGQGTVNKEGRFVAPNVTPEVYRLAVHGATSQHYLKSATYGGKDVLKDGLDLSSAAAGALEITMASDGAAIEGILEDAKLRPGTMAIVAVWPSGARRHEIHRTMVRPAEAGGAYALEGIAPGEYKIAAFAVPPREWGTLQSLDYLQTLDGAAESITVGANAKLTKGLKLRELPED